MIITQLEAGNFRKYRHLQLNHLPEQGLIIVVGGNESGKSSMGDALSFALFGRTDTLADARTGKLVLWGETQASIALSFRHQEKDYRLARSIDTQGKQTASLVRVADGVTLADNSEQVAAQLQTLLGYAYPAYVRTFYWSQQTNTDSRSDTDSLQAMAGIKSYLRLDNELQSEQAAAENTLRELKEAREAALAEREAMDIDDRLLPSLLEIREVFEDQSVSSLGLAQNIGDGGAHYAADHGLYWNLRGRSRWINGLTLAGMGLLALILLVGALFTFVPQVMAGVWSTSAGDVHGIVHSLLWAGVVLAVLTCVLLGYGWWVEQRISPLRARALVLGDALQVSVQQLGSTPQALLGVPVVDYLQERNLPPVPECVAEGHMLAPDLPADVCTYKAAPLALQATTEDLTHHLQGYGVQWENYAATADREAGQERQRVDAYIELNRRVVDQATQIAQQQHELEVRDKALELVREASRYSIQRFNGIVRQRCQSLLSEFTQTHYKTLEIDTDFALHVMSQEKGDYLEFEETSAGTQRQIALAMRIALANSLADSTGAGAQFMFLDEPFTFFDPARTRATLHSLNVMADEKSRQIWVTVQSLPAGQDKAYILHCTLGESVLEA